MTCCNTNCCQPITEAGPVGPAGVGLNGADGSDGISAFTTITASFIQPAVSANVSVEVANSDWISIGQDLFIVTGGYYEVVTITDSTHIVLENLGYPANAAPAALIPVLSKVSPSGPRGATGTMGGGAGGDLTGTYPNPTLIGSGVVVGTYPKVTVDAKGRVVTGIAGIDLDADVLAGTLDIANGGTNAATALAGFNNLSPLTTKGDLIAHNGANNVRKAVGTDGYALVADSSTADGLDYEKISPIGVHSKFVPSNLIKERTTGGCAALAYVELATNKVMLPSLAFDAAITEYAQFWIRLPKAWNKGTITYHLYWSHAAATTFDVVWGVQASAFSNDDALDIAFGAAIEVTDSGGTTNDMYITPESAALTIGNTPANYDYLIFQIYRNATDGSDTLDVDARLHGIGLKYTTNASNDD